jgi:chitinase
MEWCVIFGRGADDRASFLNLIKELRLAFEGESVTNKMPRLLLTAAVPASPEAIAAGYDVPEVVKYVDFLNVMTYDFHGHWEGQVGHNSPLFPLETAASHQRKLTVVRPATEQPCSDYCPTLFRNQNRHFFFRITERVSG